MYKLVNKVIDAQTIQYPKRQFYIIKQLENTNERGLYIANAQEWGDNSQQYALKIQKEMRDDEKTLISFLIQEQNNKKRNDQNQLSNHIIQIYDYFECQQHHILVMEISQQNLLDYITQNKNVSISEKERICYQITLPILWFHQKKYIHRDIKLENFIKVGNIFKLIDFGYVKQSNPSDQKTKQIGSLIYQAPEILENSNMYTEKVDIWSLACVYYEVLSGLPLFDGQTYQKINTQILDKNYVLTKINQLNSSQQIKTLLIKMLVYEESQRPTIQYVYNELNQYLNNTPVNKKTIQDENICAYSTKFPNRKFKIIQQLGQGGEGKLYLCQSIDWGINDKNKFALKFLQNSNPDEISFIRNLITNENQYNQTQQMKNISGLIKIFDTFQWNKQDVIVMEVGQDLLKYLNQYQQLEMQYKLKILIQLSQSIQQLHELKQIHKDIKPESFVIVGNQFKLINFGFVRNSFGIGNTISQEASPYQAPEIVQNSHGYTFSVDIWSLGCKLITKRLHNKFNSLIKNIWRINQIRMIYLKIQRVFQYK
ncbi:unnamed protein product [Paramecium pentaurelia]|uniref:Protein kinase domain-containing protein n=1 Tax=Paramecium pentaurelia TaxID=43138 RepID=A0A8S1VNR9_9CILI|nr:unnamed protein product [Paramecium pentaurelia]